MQSGELIVTGRNRATITLKGIPAEVKCQFKHEAAVVPCDPQNADTLEWEVMTDPHVPTDFVLVITWNVSGVREIKWHVAY